MRPAAWGLVRAGAAVVASPDRDAGSEFRATEALALSVAEGRITFPRPRPERFGIAASPLPEVDAGTATSLRRTPLRVGTLT